MARAGTVGVAARRAARDGSGSASKDLESVERVETFPPRHIFLTLLSIFPFAPFPFPIAFFARYWKDGASAPLRGRPGRRSARRRGWTSCHPDLGRQDARSAFHRARMSCAPDAILVSFGRSMALAPTRSWRRALQLPFRGPHRTALPALSTKIFLTQTTCPSTMRPLRVSRLSARAQS